MVSGGHLLFNTMNGENTGPLAPPNTLTAKPDLPKLSASTFYDMQKYSQYVIDAVQEIEDDIDEMTKEQKGAISYRLNNVLEIINPERREDVEALGILIKILDYEQ